MLRNDGGDICKTLSPLGFSLSFAVNIVARFILIINKNVDFIFGVC